MPFITSVEYMAIRFAGNVSNHIMGALMAVVVQEGWDSAKKWLQDQGVFAERIDSVPTQLPPNHPYHYLEYQNGVYYWHFIDTQRNLHVRLHSVTYTTPYGLQYRWEVG
jgi:hypothetical protein